MDMKMMGIDGEVARRYDDDGVSYDRLVLEESDCSLNYHVPYRV
jgi:hypothetical protein